MCWILAIAGVLMGVLAALVGLAISTYLTFALGRVMCATFGINQGHDDGINLVVGYISATVLAVVGTAITWAHTAVCAGGFKSLWF